MGNLAKLKRQFTLVLAVLGVVDLLLVVYLLWPGTSPSARLAQEQSLQEQEKTLMREVAPLKNIDKTLAQTRVDVKKFYAEKVPSEFSQISQHLAKLQQETGVTMQGIHYTPDRNSQNEKNNLPGVQLINIDTMVTGEYTKVARFINAMEQDKLVFVIDQISLTSQESGNISLQIKFQTFLKES
jgi:hypothetical protein